MLSSIEQYGKEEINDKCHAIWKENSLTSGLTCTKYDKSLDLQISVLIFQIYKCVLYINLCRLL